ncbi:MAG TPA: PAS domain S-box protein [Flavisolibacter sp.]|jgi:PAS domain S-box-containing protein
MKSDIAIPAHLQKLVLENVSDIIITTDLEFRVQSWNHIAEEFYRITAAEAIGKRMNELVSFTYHGTTLQEAIEDLQRHKIWQGEVSYTNQQGETFFFLQTVKFALDSHGNETGFLAVGRNITDRKRAEDKLKHSEKFYRTLIADSLDVTLLLNEQGEILFSTPTIERLLGYTPEEILQTNGFHYIHFEDLTWATESFEKEVGENPDIKFIVVRLRKKNGEWLWCMVRGYNLLHHPDINAIAVYIHDDTPRKQVMDALKESEKRFRHLIRDLQMGVLLQDADGRILMTNNAVVRMFDMTEEQILGGTIWELYNDVVHEDGRNFLLSERPSFKAIKTCKTVKDVVMGVWHTGKKERVWILISANPVLDANGKLANIVCSFTDITGRKKLEKKMFAEKIAHQRQIAQATIDGQEKERLEMGKELHDNIGQQLTTIKLLLDMAKSTADTETAEMVDMALKRVSDVINEVRSVSRMLVPPSLKDLGLIDSINDLIESIRTIQPIEFELDYFEFDEDYLPDNKKLALFRIVQEQLNNIVKHAQAKMVIVRLRCSGTHINLYIKDDGNGFDPATLRKGLGLTNILNRAELFGGSAEIISFPGSGCQLNVCLPNSVVNSVFE